MTASPELLEYLLDLMEPLGPVSARRMFGGAGLFRDGVMFGLISDDTLYLKADDRNRADFEAAGMAAFTYEKQGKRQAISYYQAPAEAMEDPDALAAWARGAQAAALRAQAGKRKKA